MRLPWTEPPPTDQRSLKDALQLEYDALWRSADQEPVKFERIEDYYAAVHREDQAALCLSGGGVRSAAFGLGVLQALAGLGLLDKFQYLSTVSGGGYISGWLSRWIRDADHQVGPVAEALASASTGPRQGPGRGRVDGEPLQIAALRERSNFLTPHVGVASKDSWAALAIVARNLLLNWLVFVPALMAVALLFQLYRIALYRTALDAPPSDNASMLLGLLGAMLLTGVTFLACRKLPSHAKPPMKEKAIFWWIAAPSLIWALLLPVVAAPFLVSGKPPGWLTPYIPPLVAQTDGEIGERYQAWSLAWSVGVLAAVPPLVGYGVAWLSLLRHGDRRHFFRNVPAWLVAATASSIALGAVAYLAVGLFPPPLAFDGPGSCWRLDLLAVLGPLWVVASHLLLSAVFSGFRWVVDDRDREPPPKDPTGLTADMDREWLARLSALKLRPAVAWCLLGCACLLLPELVFEGHLHTLAAGAVGAASGLLAVFGGASSLASAGFKAIADKQRRVVPFNAVVGGATVVFALALFMSLSRAELSLAAWIGGLNGPPISVAMLASDTMLRAQLEVALGLAAVTIAVPLMINVNRFSLHGLYRNRLARAFLGAARGAVDTKAHAAAAGSAEPRMDRGGRDPFTGFDPADNVRMADLWPQRQASASYGAQRPPPPAAKRPQSPPAPRNALFPVVNTTLNLTGCGRLAWQERKAESFAITPLSCGYGGLPAFTGAASPASGSGRPGKEPGKIEVGTYVPTGNFGGRERGLGLEGSGISLATAMSISGAAVSPNRGYSTSPATAFLMTLFNVRLGAWLPNPRRCHATDVLRSGPRYALAPLFWELLGMANADGKDIYLSDGGHFENLGLYEMVRRRCRFIVVSDAGCDPECSFADLGNAVRKIRVDQRVAITFDKMEIVKRGSKGCASVAHAIGRIEYPEHDEPGWLLYLKPSYFDQVPGMPLDVRAYAIAKEAFPHETTADQWFGESQFESYRRLGEFLTTRLMEQGSRGKGPPHDLAGFLSDILPKGAERIQPRRPEDPAGDQRQAAE